ncbi:hypothetical protein VB1_CDS0031 [Arthrobacter phage Marchesin]|nr:hypothetical protein VB1_CDS0031 [Arthrobacter phage Marchesin]
MAAITPAPIDPPRPDHRHRGDNQDQPPEVDVHDLNRQHPDPSAAAARVLAFVSWFGDGIVSGALVCPPLYARDLEALALIAQQAHQRGQIVSGG